MTKKLLRSMMVGFCVFVATVIVAYMVFVYTYNTSVSRTTEILEAETSVTAEETVNLTPNEIITADYYIARYNGEFLAIYAVGADKEEFLYTLDARIEDISDAELEQLRNGVVLKDKTALASFEEDFTS